MPLAHWISLHYIFIKRPLLTSFQSKIYLLPPNSSKSKCQEIFLEILKAQIGWKHWGAHHKSVAPWVVLTAARNKGILRATEESLPAPPGENGELRLEIHSVRSKDAGSKKGPSLSKTQTKIILKQQQNRQALTLSKVQPSANMASSRQPFEMGAGISIK